MHPALAKKRIHVHAQPIQQVADLPISVAMTGQSYMVHNKSGFEFVVTRCVANSRGTRAHCGLSSASALGLQCTFATSIRRSCHFPLTASSIQQLLFSQDTPSCCQLPHSLPLSGPFRKTIQHTASSCAQPCISTSFALAIGFTFLCLYYLHLHLLSASVVTVTDLCARVR